MYVGDILRTTSSRVVTIGMNETVDIAARLMRASNVSALLVKASTRSDDTAVLALCTERDVVRAVAERGAGALAMKLSHLVAAQPHLRCSSQDSLAFVRDLMRRCDVRHVPVIDSGRPVGVVSLRDIIAAVDEAGVDTAQAA